MNESNRGGGGEEKRWEYNTWAWLTKAERIWKLLLHPRLCVCVCRAFILRCAPTAVTTDLIVVSCSLCWNETHATPAETLRTRTFIRGRDSRWQTLVCACKHECPDEWGMRAYKQEPCFVSCGKVGLDTLVRVCWLCKPESKCEKKQIEEKRKKKKKRNRLRHARR